MTPEEWIGLAAIYLTLCGLVAWFGESRGRGALGWFWFAMLTSPLVAFLVALFKDERG